MGKISFHVLAKTSRLSPFHLLTLLAQNPNPNSPILSNSPFSSLFHRFISSSSTRLCNFDQKLNCPNPNFQNPISQNPNSITPDSLNPDFLNPETFSPYPKTRTRTPLEKQFETWIDKLKPGFTPEDVIEALRSQSDPDLALDIFKWTGQMRGYKHNDQTYLTIIEIARSGNRFGHLETLIDEVIAGACNGSVPLYNSIIRYCCSRKQLFKRAFDVYKKMLKLPDCKPTLETYTFLLNAVLRKFNKLNVCYVYLHAVRSLHRQMKAAGIVPDTFALNLIIKAYSMCLDMDGAIRVFREMGLYGCEPNGYSYSYIAKGLCEKGRVNQGLEFYDQMRGKGFVATSSCYMIVICSLSLDRRFEEAIKIMFDMLHNSKVPDLLTYKTLLEGLCREGRGNEAFELLEELMQKEGSMGEKTYRKLLDGLHFLGRE